MACPINSYKASPAAAHRTPLLSDSSLPFSFLNALPYLVPHEEYIDVDHSTFIIAWGNKGRVKAHHTEHHAGWGKWTEAPAG